MRPFSGKRTRFLLGLIAVFALLSGCTRAVDVPHSQWAMSSQSEEGYYRIVTNDGQFTVREFSVTDSTVVITKLSGSDKQYGSLKIPMTVPLQNVKEIARLETNYTATSIVLVTGFVVAVGILVARAMSSISIN